MSHLFTQIAQERQQQEATVQAVQAVSAVPASDPPLTQPKPGDRTGQVQAAPIPTRAEQPNDRTVSPNGATERSDRARVATDPTGQPTPARAPSATVMAEMAQGIPPAHKRLTERYSFEIYADQKRLIRNVQTLYEERTGQRLPKSRIIREALDTYLRRVLGEPSGAEE